MKLIPQGHFGKDDLIFIVSDEVYEKYKEATRDTATKTVNSYTASPIK